MAKLEEDTRHNKIGKYLIMLTMLAGGLQFVKLFYRMAGLQ